MLTIVVTTGYDPKAAWMTLAAVAAQTIANRIELLFCVRPGSDVTPVRHLLEAVATYEVTDDMEIDTVEKCSARLSLRARAPYVAMIEDHAFPDPMWAETMVATFEETKADVIGSGILNANPAGGLSWANFMLSYAHWSAANPEGPIDWVSHHNGCFRTALLQDLSADEVIEGCNREGTIISTLKSKGAKLYFKPDCRIRHINPSNLASTWQLRSDVGRLYAWSRAQNENWSVFKRFAYVVLAPVIPFLRYVRMRKEIFVQLPEIKESSHGFLLFIGLSFDAAGQMIGYIGNLGEVRERIGKFEMDRAMHLTSLDKQSLYPERG